MCDCEPKPARWPASCCDEPTLLIQCQNSVALADNTAKEQPEAAHLEALARTGFWGAQAAGCIPFARTTGRMLFLKRSGDVQEPGTWGNPGGAHLSDEKPSEAALRELREETGYTGPIELVEMDPFEQGTFRYANYLALVPDEFTPTLNWESDAYQWANVENLPAPLHPGLEWVFAPAKAMLAACIENRIDELWTVAPTLRTRSPSPELQAWLAGSALVDEQGVPYVAFHGSAFAFDRFDLARAGTGRGFASERALFFSFDAWTATYNALSMGARHSFGKPTPGSAHPENEGVIYPVYIRAERPCVSPMVRYRPADMLEHLTEAQAGGWDAVLFPNLETHGDRCAVAVFSPDQVRSIFDQPTRAERELRSFDVIAWDFDGTLIDHPRSADFWRLIQANPYRQTHYIVTHRSHGHECLIFDDLAARGAGIDPLHFAGIINVPDELFETNDPALLTFKGEQCSRIGAQVLVDDMPRLSAPGCAQHGVRLVHPDDL